MKRIAIIPARGGSKRIPRKNIKEFLGKPIIAYSIEAALTSNVFDEVMVSTDDEEIANVARTYGAAVPFMRSAATSNDYVHIAEVLLEVIHEYERRGNKLESICCILATAPLIQPDNIIKALDKLSDEEVDSVYPVVPFSYPILRSLVMDANGYVRMKWPEYYNSRSQDLESAYHDSGTFYWIKTEKLKEYERIVTPRSLGIVVEEMTVQDIDTEEDWKLAELKYRLLHGM